jgi:hypothetical protein
MKAMKVVQPVAYACAAALMASGSPQDAQHHPAAPQRFPGENRAALPQQRGGEAVSENEWQEIVDWMEVHCPNRMEFYLHRLENRPVQQAAVKKQIVELYRQISAVRNDDLLKQAMIVHAESQDKMFGASINLREAWQRNDQRQVMLAKQNLQAATAQVIDAEIDVKQARVQKLQAEVEQMMKRKPQLVAERFNQQINLARSPLASPKATGDAEGISPPSDEKH